MECCWAGTILKESGCIWEVVKDSVDRLTISNKMEFPFFEGDTAKIAQ